MDDGPTILLWPEVDSEEADTRRRVGPKMAMMTSLVKLAWRTMSPVIRNEMSNKGKG